MKFLKKQKNILLLSIFLLCGIAFHFYNLNWGAPYYFHPDERNIASAVDQLQYPHQMNPHFFAYGSLPIYAIYFSGVLTNYLSPFLSGSPVPILTVTFSQAIIISRFFSALFATLLIPFLYVITKNLATKHSHENKNNETAGLLAAFLVTTSTGFIQFSHFGTFEMWLTFFSVMLFWLCVHYLHKPGWPLVILSAVTFGILMAVKVSSIVLLPIPIAIFALHSVRSTGKTHHDKKIKFSHLLHIGHSGFLSLLSFLRKTIIFALISIIVYFLTNPYIILDTKDFISSMNYESSVALGTEPVFYTGNFYNTTPVIYQFLHVYPFILNPLITILFIPAFIILLWQVLKTKNKSYLILYTFFLILFLSQAYLFVKWTRYMIPTLPFMYIIIALSLANNETVKQSNNIIKSQSIKRLFISIVVIVCTIFSFSYFKTAFINLDTRVAALLFATKHIPTDANVLSEPADLGVMPFQDAFPHYDTFNFYEYDNHSQNATPLQLKQKLQTADYVILPSQRILQTRIEDPKRYPNGHNFYVSLLNGSLGFHKIYETPCDIFCNIVYLGDPVYWWEQTASVFDHPPVFIFKKNNNAAY